MATSAKGKVVKILSSLKRAYPNAGCSLSFSNPLELLVATILSAQCTDALVNKVTVDLFKKYKTASDYANAKLESLEKDIARINFYRNKAAQIQKSCRMLIERFNGIIPKTMDELIQLPGVARKTANVVLGNAFGIAAGIVVDTHVMRVSQRLFLTKQTDRERIEEDLMALIPKDRWISFSHQIIIHGRTTCIAKSPKCLSCPLGKALCPSYRG